MRRLIAKDIRVPASVPRAKAKEYINNYLDLTYSTGNLVLFAGDQRIEHLNKDFYGENELGAISADDASPRHLFDIASVAKVSALAAHYGLISSYGKDYPMARYVVKMNGTTNIVSKEQRDPMSEELVEFSDVLKLKEELPTLRGVGYTIFLGSEYEPKMLEEAGQLVADAHQAGLVVILWVYPKGKAVKEERDPKLIAGACAVAASLGADFVKVNSPEARGRKSEELFKEAVLTAGRTKVVCSGGESVTPKKFLETLYKQLLIGGVSGSATGRNIHQKPLAQAVNLANAIAALTFAGDDLETATRVYETGELSANLQEISKWRK